MRAQKHSVKYNVTETAHEIVQSKHICVNSKNSDFNQDGGQDGWRWRGE